MKARTQTALFLSLILISSATASCGHQQKINSEEDETNTVPTDTVIQTDETCTSVCYTDHLGEMDFSGADFRIRTIANANVHSYVNVEEETGDVFDDALYKRNRAVENRLNIVIKEEIEPVDVNGAAPIRKLILAGDDAYEMGNLRCTDALTFWEDNLIYPISEIPHVDLSMPYWAEKLNHSITIGGHQYTAIGAYDVNVLDLTYVLLFNKKMAETLDFQNPYTLVNTGTWTIDAMFAMMTAAVSDLNGDGTMDGTDQWGYLANSKQVLPDFWIAAGEMSILKDSSDRPYINMNTDRFTSVIDRVFDITWDAGTWFSKYKESTDVPEDNIRIFSEGRAMFLDSSLYHIKALRDMETDFGILPYPKYDESQAEYYSRVTYYWANVVPVTNTHPEMTGAVLEALNCESANIVVPAYFEIALKGKYSRDEDSLAMLDLIQKNRVVDIGDTILCADIRDGFVAQLFQSNQRDFASALAKSEKRIQKKIDKIPIWD